MSRCALIIRIIICLITVRGILSAQQATPSRFQHFTMADGLPSNLIRSIAIGPDGYTWLATGNGLARWDGQRIVSVNTLAPTVQLPEKEIRMLFCDSHGNVWVKYLNLPGMYLLNSNTFRSVVFDDPQFEGRIAFPIRSTEDAQGNVWLGTPRGLSKFDWKTQRMQHYPLVWEGKPKISLQADALPDGSIWLSTNCGMFRFDPSSGQYEYIRLFEDDKKHHITVFDKYTSFLWITRWYDDHHGIVLYDPFKRRIVQEWGKKAGTAQAFINTEISQVLAEPDKVWFCCNEGGLVMLDKRTGQFRRYQPDETNPASIKTWSVLSIAADPYGNHWVSTESSLEFLPKTDKTAQLLSHNPYNLQSLIFSKSNTALALRNGKVVFGTDRGLSIYSPDDNRFINKTIPGNTRSSVYNNVVVSLAAVDDHTFWACSWEGLYRIDSNNGAVLEVVEIDDTAWGDTALNVAHHLFRDKYGGLWISYNGSIIQRWHKGQLEIFREMTADGNAKNEGTYCFAPIDERYFLIGTSDGITRCDQDLKKFEHLPLQFPGIAAPVKVVAICAAPNGTMYALANDHLFRFNPGLEPGSATLIPFSTPLSNCIDLIADQRGDIWIGSETGILRYSPADGSSYLFDSRNYLQGNTMNSVWLFQTATKDSKGRLYFAGTSGISILRPEALIADAASPIARITNVLINNQIAALDSAVHCSRKLELDWWQNNLSFDFAALGSSLPSLNRYAYQLLREGWWGFSKDGQWVELEERSTVDFSNLAPGRYLLRLKVANSDGVWSQEPAVLNITIRPPWYNSIWAYWCYFLVLGGAIWYGNRYILQRKLHKAETTRLKELDSFKTRFFTNITHEFRTPLTVILGMSEQLRKHFANGAKDAHDRGIDMIQRNGQGLLQLINQILDLAKLESGKLELRLEQADMVGYCRYICESFHSFGQARQVDIHFLAESPSVMMDFDKEKVLAILSNLLSNALKFTESGGHVYVQTAQIDINGQPFFQIKVRDTGTGIPEAQLSRIFDRFYQVDNSSTRKGEGSGIGLALTRELVHLMQGKIAVSSIPGNGSTFTVELPIRTGADKVVLQQDAVGKPHFIQPEKELDQKAVNSDLPLLLMVEDNQDVRQYLAECVGGAYQLLSAADGAQGIQLALEYVPDIIVSDVMMPQKDGFELCDTLKNDERSSHIPIVLLTAKADVRSRIEGLTRGADDYLAKPFERDELLVRLHNLLENRRRLQARYARFPQPEPGELPDQELEDAFLQKMRSIIEANLSDADFEMPQLERAMGMSRSQIFRKLKALTGQAPSLYIRSYRLHRAKEMLANRDLTIAEIAYEVGFTTPAYFSTAFLETFGKSPSEFR